MKFADTVFLLALLNPRDKERPDKEWSLTDCISFAVMHERGIQEAITSDHHFEQAGFRILLKE